MTARVMASVLALWVSVSATEQTSLTIYNQNFGLIKERHQLVIPEGRSRISVRDAATTIEPSSVQISFVGGSPHCVILQQNFLYDLVSRERLLERCLEKEVVLTMTSGELRRGRLLAYSRGQYVLLSENEEPSIVEQSSVRSIEAAASITDLVTVPTLVWSVESDSPHAALAEVSYLADSIGWEANYVAVLLDSDSELQLSGWATINNRSGKAFDGAEIRMVAGNVRWERPRREAFDREFGAQRGVQNLAIAARGVVQTPFFEYHLYSLTEPTDLANYQMKQVALFEPTSVKAKKAYWSYLSDGRSSVDVVLSCTNSEPSGLGIPLPAGKVRVMKRDLDGALQFVGEDRISHTSVQEEITLNVGKAFDLLVESSILHVTTKRGSRAKETREVIVKNRKDEPVEISLYWNAGYNHEVEYTEHPYRRSDANTIEFVVPVEANGEYRFTVKSRWKR